MSRSRQEAEVRLCSAGHQEAAGRWYLHPGHPWLAGVLCLSPSPASGWGTNGWIPKCLVSPHPTQPYNVPQDPEAGGPAHLCILFHHGSLHLLVPFPVSPVVKVHGKPGRLWAQRASPERGEQHCRDPQPRGSSCTGEEPCQAGEGQGAGVSLCLQALVLILSVSRKRGATSLLEGRSLWTSGDYQDRLFGSSVLGLPVEVSVHVLGAGWLLGATRCHGHQAPHTP